MDSPDFGIGADNLLAGSRLSLTAELDVHGIEPIVEDVLIETAALTVQRTAPRSNEGTGRVAQVDPLAATVPDLRRRPEMPPPAPILPTTGG